MAAAPFSKAGLALDRLGAVLSTALIVGLAVLFAISIHKSPYFNPIGETEEAAYTYTSAHNYLHYGFLNSLFLQDFSNSSNPADHPYVYDHMPAGPDTFTALLFKAFGENNYAAERTAFALIFVAGLVVYVKFVGIVLKGFGLKGASWAVLFIGPALLFQTADRQPYSPFPLLVFAPLVLLNKYYSSGRRRYLALGLAVGLVSAVYLEYMLLSAVAVCWTLLFLTRLVRVHGRELLAFFGVLGLGVGLHLVQNIIYLGPGLFVQELTITLGNRMRGVPSQADIQAFYQRIGVVEHGSHAPDFHLLVQHLRDGIYFEGRTALLAAVALALGWALFQRSRSQAGGWSAAWRGNGGPAAGWFARLTIWIGLTLTLPLVALPAFSAEVTLSGEGANRYFLAIAVIAGFGYVLRIVAQTLSRQTAASPSAAAFAMSGLVLAGLAVSGASLARPRWGDLGALRNAVQQSRDVELAAISNFAGAFSMTNINSPIVGFFTHEATNGVCGLDSLPESGEVDWIACKISFMRRHDYYATQRPRYFFFFTAPDLFPGFADCLPAQNEIGQTRAGTGCVPAMEQRLSQRFPKMFENGLVKVFDLDRRFGN